MRRKKNNFNSIDLILGVLASCFFIYCCIKITNGFHYKWDWAKLVKYIVFFNPESHHWESSLLLQGMFITIKLSIWASLIALFVGIIMGIARTSKSLLNRMAGGIYVGLVRNMPPLVLIFIFYFFISSRLVNSDELGDFFRVNSVHLQGLISLITTKPSRIARFISAAITLGIFEGAYITEIVRAGVQSIPKGQWEASRALGMSGIQVMCWVILPQAIQRILPPLAGQFVSTIKDSAIVSVISIQELTFQGMELMSSTYLTFEIWITIVLMYMVLTFPCSLAIQTLSKKRLTL